MTSTAKHTSKCRRCLRCGRVLRVSKTYGPVCRAKIRLAMLNEAIHGFAAAQIEKARELIADGGLIPTSRPGVFRAVSSKGDGTTYLTHPATCGCPAAKRGKATPCYHSLAAKMLVATGKAA